MKWDFAKYPRIEVAFNNEGHLILRKPGANAVPANTFTGEQVSLMWEKILASGHPVNASSVTLFNGIDAARDRYTAEPASILNGNGNNKAYETWQLARFEAVHCEMRVNYGNPQFCLMAVKKAGPNKPEKKQAPVLTLPVLEGEKPAPVTPPAQGPRKGALKL